MSKHASTEERSAASAAGGHRGASKGTSSWPRRWMLAVLLLLGAVLLANYQRPIAPVVPADDSKGIWPSYAGSDAAIKYSPLDQINRANVRALREVWRYSTGDWERIVTTGAQATYAFQTTPILVAGNLVACTHRHVVFALDPATGKERWRFDPRLAPTPQGDAMLKCRGVAAWTDPELADGAACKARLILGAGLRVFALDASTGQPCAGFGEQGSVAVDAGSLEFPDEVGLRSPPAIVGNLAVFGSVLRDIYRVNSPSGAVRAFDLRSGALRWEFDPVPRDPADPVRPDWGGDSADFVGSGNVWSFITADPLHDLVFLPTTSPAADFYGGHRPGANRWANSLVALQASSGKLVWAFQTTHHDIWDTDLPAQPILVDIERDGARIPAVVQLTKQSFVFVFNRLTGEPLFPIEERPVPQHTDVPGEWISPTQPFPVTIPPLSRQQLKADEAWGFTPLDRRACSEQIAAYNSEGIFTPPSLKGTVLMPAGTGGMNWGGGAVDPSSNILIVPTYDMPARIKLVPRPLAEGGGEIRQKAGAGAEEAIWPMKGTPYTADLQFILSPLGAPCSPPPWAKLSAVDLNAGKILWQVPMGSIENLAPVPIPLVMGAPFSGGPIVTAGGIAFMAGGTDRKIRAYDVQDGEILWTAKLPAGGMAVPMTYSVGGTQYVVIAAGGSNIFPGPMGDSVVAFALPR